MAKPKVLIANRGEIAVRIIRTCRELGIPTRRRLLRRRPRRPARRDGRRGVPDRAGARASESYLSIDTILEAARQAEGHDGPPRLRVPGRERAVRRRPSTDAGPHVRRAAGRRRSRRWATRRRRGGPPTPAACRSSPARREPVDLRQAKQQAERIGFPLLVKAAFGGGGKGMHVVESPTTWRRRWSAPPARRSRYFGRPEVFLERYVDRAHHVEAQILADTHGNVSFLGERDCSRAAATPEADRRDARPPSWTTTIRARIGEAAIALAREAGYVNAGTVEFIVDEDGDFYFLEMNTRLQVEHPVTEMVTGLDLVALQLEVALGEHVDVEPDARGPRDPVPDQRRGSRPELPAGPRPDHALPGARRTVRPGGLGRGRGPRGPGRLRLDVRAS